MANYREAPLATLPKSLDPAQYLNLTPEFRRAEEQRAALRAQLKRQYQMQLNNPHRKELIDDPAMTRWVYARSNPYTNFKPTMKTSTLGILFSVAPIFILSYLFHKSRGNKTAAITAGTQKQPKFKLLN